MRITPRNSSDRTREIAGRYTDKVIVNPWPGYAAQKNFAAQQAANEWIFNLDADEIGLVLLGDYAHLKAGDEATRTGRVMDVGVDRSLVGRVIDPLGRALDGGGPIVCSHRLPIEREAKGIMDRAAVTAPLQTGIKEIGRAHV